MPVAIPLVLSSGPGTISGKVVAASLGGAAGAASAPSSVKPELPISVAPVAVAASAAVTVKSPSDSEVGCLDCVYCFIVYSFILIFYLYIYDFLKFVHVCVFVYIME